MENVLQENLNGLIFAIITVTNELNLKTSNNIIQYWLINNHYQNMMMYIVHPQLNAWN